MIKIIRRSFTLEIFKQIAGKKGGWKKTKVIEEGLPDDAILIHLSFDVEKHMVDMFFLSDEGTEIKEMGSIYSVESTCPTFQTIETIDEDELLKTLIKFKTNINTPNAKSILPKTPMELHVMKTKLIAELIKDLKL